MAATPRHIRHLDRSRETDARVSAAGRQHREQPLDAIELAKQLDASEGLDGSEGSRTAKHRDVQRRKPSIPSEREGGG